MGHVCRWCALLLTYLQVAAQPGPTCWASFLMEPACWSGLPCFRSAASTMLTSLYTAEFASHMDTFFCLYRRLALILYTESLCFKSIIDFVLKYTDIIIVIVSIVVHLHNNRALRLCMPETSLIHSRHRQQCRDALSCTSRTSSAMVQDLHKESCHVKA